LEKNNSFWDYSRNICELHNYICIFSGKPFFKDLFKIKNESEANENLLMPKQQNSYCSLKRKYTISQARVLSQEVTM
jgi:hypothetical protein